MKHQRGMALILVLMIAGILGLLTFQVSLTAREQVARAQLLADRAEAMLRAQSREAALDYTLLTTSWTSPGAPDNPYATAWNFRGQPFTVDGVTYRIQDVSGLMVLPFLGTQSFTSVVRQLGVEPARAERLGEQLVRLQGAATGLPRLGEPSPEGARAPGVAPRSDGWPVFPVQSLTELRSLEDMDEALFSRLVPLLTLYPSQGFNPLTAPPELLAARLPPSALRGALELRAQGKLDEGSLQAVTGLSADDFTTIYPGPALRVGLELAYGGVKIRRSTTVVLRPYVNEALVVWSRREQDGGPST